MTARHNPARLTTPDAWRWFQDIMQAIQLDGGTVSGVNAIMAVAEQIGQQITRTADHLHSQERHSYNLLAAVPTREEAEVIWQMYVGPGAQLPEPDPEWIATYIPTRVAEEAPDVTL